MSHRGALLIALLGVAATGATCKGGDGQSSPPPPAPEPVDETLDETLVRAPPVTEIEGIDMALVPPTARADVIRILNESFAYCGCARTVASCLANKAQCPCPIASQRVADFVVNQFQQGASTSDVETQLLEGFSEGYNQKPYDLAVADQPVKGSAEAKVTIAEFADFRCPHCASAFEVLAKLANQRSEVQVAYFYFPLSGGGETSIVAAEAAEEARKQGRFWQMAGLMYRNQHALGYDDIMRYGKEAGLDVVKLAKALDTREHKQTVLADKRLGEKLGIMSTPSIYVNGRSFGLARTERVFNMRIDMELDRGRCE